MKVFVILATIATAYYYFLTSSMNLVLNQTMQLGKQYQTAAEQADQIASGATSRHP